MFWEWLLFGVGWRLFSSHLSTYQQQTETRIWEIIPSFRKTPKGHFRCTQPQSFAHHLDFEKPVGQHWYMSTPNQPTQDSNPGPSDHESHSLRFADMDFCCLFYWMFYKHLSLQVTGYQSINQSIYFNLHHSIQCYIIIYIIILKI